MHKLSMMVAADEVLYESKERDRARQEKWLADIYTPSQEQAGWAARLISTLFGALKQAQAHRSRIAERAVLVNEPNEQARTI